jgi:hypothetical protein
MVYWRTTLIYALNQKLKVKGGLVMARVSVWLGFVHRSGLGVWLSDRACA